MRQHLTRPLSQQAQPRLLLCAQSGASLAPASLYSTGLAFNVYRYQHLDGGHMVGMTTGNIPLVMESCVISAASVVRMFISSVIAKQYRCVMQGKKY